MVPPLPLRAALPPALRPLLLGPRLPPSNSRSLTRLPPTLLSPSRLLPCSSRAPALVCSARWPRPQRECPTRRDIPPPIKSGVGIFFFSKHMLTSIFLQRCCCRFLHRPRHRWLLRWWLQRPRRGPAGSCSGPGHGQRSLPEQRLPDFLREPGL